MGHQYVNGQSASRMKAALAGLLAQLRLAVVDGFVPERVFMAHARTLGLGEAERNRLRVELARLGLPVGGTEAHTEADRPDAETVAQGRGENVFPRVVTAQALLRRYETT